MDGNNNIRLEFEPSLIFNKKLCVTCEDETKFWFSIPSSATCVRDVLGDISEAFGCSGPLYIYVEGYYVPPHMNLHVLKDADIKVRGPKYGPRNADHDDGSLGLGCSACEGQESETDSDSSWFSGGDEMDDNTGSDGSDSGVSSSEYSNDEDSDSSKASEDEMGPSNDEKENDPNISTQNADGVQGVEVIANKKRPLEYDESDPKGNYHKLQKLTGNVQHQDQVVNSPPSSANVVIYSNSEEEDYTEEVLCTHPMSLSNENRKKSIPTPVPISVAIKKHIDLKLGLPRKIRSSSSIASTKISKDNKQMQKHVKENNNRSHSYSKPLAIERFRRSYAPTVMKTLDTSFLAFASSLNDSPTACLDTAKKFYWGRSVPYHPSLTDNVVKFQHDGRFTRNILNNLLHLLASPSWKWILRVTKWRGGSNSDVFTGEGILVNELGVIMQCVSENEIGCFKKDRDDDFFILMEEKNTDVE